MKIIDNEQTRKSIERHLEYLGGSELIKDYTLVNANLVVGSGDKRTERLGITEALTAIKNKEKVIIYSFEEAQSLYSESNSKNKEFMQAMASPSSLYIRMPDIVTEIKAELAERKFYHQAMDLYSSASISNNVAGSILHSADRVSADITAERGRTQLGLKGSDDQVRKKLEELRTKGSGVQYQGIISGLFVDVEGTLLNSDNTLNDSILDKMLDYSKQGPVTIWTGGELGIIQSKLGPKLHEALEKRNSRLYTRTPILSKHAFRGCSVDTVMDDISQSKLELDYDITSHDHIIIK